MRVISALSVEITTHCNRRCPECCCGIGVRPATHHSWAYFEKLAGDCYGIDRIHITGGEPTAHPKFADFSPLFRRLFGCRVMTLGTNCFKARQNLEALKQYDSFYITRYGQDNAAEVEWMQKHFQPKIALLFDAEHVGLSRRGSGQPCDRGVSEMAVFAEGKFFPCCVSPGVKGAASLAPCKDWASKVVDVPMPCSGCWFSP